MGDRLQAGDRPPSAYDGEMLAPVLDGIEDVGEVAGGVRRGDLWH